MKLITKKAMAGDRLTRQEIIHLSEMPLEELLNGAQFIGSRLGKKVELCSILSAKTGKCSENCAFCAQSSHWDTPCVPSDMVSCEAALKNALRCEEEGIHRFSLVTSGRTLSDDEIDHLCSIYRTISRETGLRLCASHGLLSSHQLEKLSDAGVSRYHCNLEAGASFFPKVCTTHTTEEKKVTLKNARAAGLELCSGGIMGMGESNSDRIDLIMELRELNVQSVPINILSAIGGTPLEKEPPMEKTEILRWGAITRFCLPYATIRYAGGRNILGEKFEDGLKGGINGLLSGNYLTTTGSTISSDIKTIEKLGLEAARLEVRR